jgi:hypothetical protein
MILPAREGGGQVLLRFGMLALRLSRLPPRNRHPSSSPRVAALKSASASAACLPESHQPPVVVDSSSCPRAMATVTTDSASWYRSSRAN